MAAIVAGGVSLRTEIAGSGPRTIVLVCGIGDDLDAWGHQLPDFLAAGHRVVRFDNRGVRDSPSVPGPYTSVDMAGDTKAVVDGLGLHDIDLVGISMGGTIAQEYALAWPGDLRTLVLANTYARATPYSHRIFTAWGKVALTAGMASLAQMMIPWIFSPAFIDERADEVAEIEAGMAATAQTPDGFVAQLGALLDHDVTKRLGRIRVPTLVLAAEADILIPPTSSRLLHEGLPNAEWAIVPGGHAAMWEAPEAFNTTILDFVAHR